MPTPSYISLEENVFLVESVNEALAMAGISLESSEGLELKSLRIKLN